MPSRVLAHLFKQLQTQKGADTKFIVLLEILCVCLCVCIFMCRPLVVDFIYRYRSFPQLFADVWAVNI